MKINRTDFEDPAAASIERSKLPFPHAIHTPPDAPEFEPPVDTAEISAVGQAAAGAFNEDDNRQREQEQRRRGGTYTREGDFRQDEEDPPQRTLDIAG